MYMCYGIRLEEVGHNSWNAVLLSRAIYTVLLLLTQWVDLGCEGVYCKCAIDNQLPLV